MRRLLLLAAPALAAAVVAAPSVSFAAKPAKVAARVVVDPALAPILADARREADRARDQYRHPAETLAFFQVKPGMTVVDYMPSGGWWTRVLVPYLGPQGRYVGLNPDVRTASEGLKRNFGDLAATFPARAASWTGVPAERVPGYNTDTLPAELKGQVDRVLVFREMHNLWRFGILRTELLAIRDLLKADGLLGIEQHRAKAGASASYTNGGAGYMREKDVIALVEAHGFELVAKSEINANPKDPANHKDGVWTLPPNLRGATDATRPALQAIGESDRMTLLFKKRP